MADEEPTCLVLAMNEASEADVEYEDVPFVSYEYPTLYRKKIRNGTRFVYYRGRRRVGGGRQPQVYFGTGVIGEIRESRNPGRLVCELLDGARFPTPVPFKDDDGNYLEPGGVRRGYYQQGVRRISEEVLNGIVAWAEMSSEPVGVSTGPRYGAPERYASPEDAREIEIRSRAIVTAYLLERFPQARVIDMPTNNPGFDLETDISGLRYVEVKGTRSPRPEFILSEGERQFGAANREEYLFAVVFGMDLETETHKGIGTVRAPLGSAHRLTPYQWTGLLNPTAEVDLENR